MRRIIVAVFTSLDGIMQAPGGPEEDPTGGFEFGGWTFAYDDDAVGASLGELLSEPYDLLLGRRTYDIFSAYWPYQPTDPAASGYSEGDAAIAEGFNAARKYVLTHRPDTLRWQNSEALGPDPVARLRELKAADGPLLLVQGSSELIHLLLAHDLVDQLNLLIYPVVLGHGKRVFADRPTQLKLVGSQIGSAGIISARYQPDGAVKTGSFAAVEPSAEEIERRTSLR